MHSAQNPGRGEGVRESLYRILLALAPARFRDDHGEEMLRLFTESVRDTEQVPSFLRRIVAVLLLYVDVLVTVMVERGRGALNLLRRISGAGGKSDFNTMNKQTENSDWGLNPNRMKGVFKQLRRQPGFTLLAVLTLGIGIGVTTGVFQVVNGVLLRPLPYPDAEELFVVGHTLPGRDLAPVGPGTFLDWRNRAEVFDMMTMIDALNASIVTDATPFRVSAAAVSRDFFATLGVTPDWGRGIRPQDEVEGAEQVVVLSNGFAIRMFGSPEGAQNQILNVDGVDRRVVGVMGRAFQYPLDTPHELWIPFEFNDANRALRGTFYSVIGRASSGRAITQVDQTMQRIAGELREENPGQYDGWGTVVVPLRSQLLGDIRPSLLILMASAGIVLLIGCANVAHLILSRNTSRTGEFALRTALGASRRDLLGMLVAESVMISIGAGVLGLLIASVGTDLLITYAPTGLPRVDGVSLDLPVFGFALITSLLTGIVAGLVPAMQSTAKAPGSVIRERVGRASGSPKLLTFRGLLLGAEVAVVAISLIGAALLFKSFQVITESDPGFNTHGQLVLGIDLPSTQYPDAPAVQAFIGQFSEGLRQIPGVLDVGVATHAPTRGGFQLFYEPGDRPPSTDPADRSLAMFEGVTPEYMPVMGYELVEGRFFEHTDGTGGEPVVIINQTMAELLWPGESVLDKTIVTGPTTQRIVGVVEDIRQWGLDQDIRPQFYVVDEAMGFRWLSRDIVVATQSDDPASFIPQVQQVLAQIAPGQPLSEAAPLENVLGTSVSAPRFRALIVSLLAIMALSLGIVGIFGSVSYTVSQRQREIAIRISLGAPTSEILTTQTMRNLRPVLLGSLVGLTAAFLASGFLSSMLFGVSARDPLTYLAVAGVLIITGMLATLIPSMRVSQLDPVTVLRLE